MDFAPYQDSSPELNRTLSPPLEGRRSFSPGKRTSPVQASPGARISTSSPPINPYITNNATRAFPDPWASVREDSVAGGWGGEDVEGGRGGIGSGIGTGIGGNGDGRNDFETSLPIRMDYAACLAYLLLPPAGGVLLLIVERKSDYVRFHAWQSSLLFSALFVLHLLVSWSRFLSWVLFVVNLGLIAFLTMRAYRDADTLDRFEVPFFGPLASKFLDDE